MKIAITCRQAARDLDDYREMLDRHGLEITCPLVMQELAGDELVQALEGATGVIAGDDRFTADVMDRCPELRVISKWGVGVDGIDREAAARRGITVTNTPGMFDDDVADVAMGYLVMLARQLHLVDAGVRQGGWPKPVGKALNSMVLGVVGLGGIGIALCRRALAMRMTVLGADPSPTARAAAKELGVTTLEVDELLRETDAVSLHCPLNDQTRHLLNEQAFALMRPGAYVVNTSRGAVIDELGLVGALEGGKLSGAALDVFEEEPLPMEHRLRGFDNVILGSHNASNTRQGSARTHRRAVGNLLEALGLESP